MKPRGNRLKLIQFDWQCGSAEIEASIQQHLSQNGLNWSLSLQMKALQARLARPMKWLSSYTSDRRSSELATIFRFTKQLRESVDAVVVVGAKQHPWAAQMIFDTCCPPYWNELHRGERGSKPKMYFLCSESENDQIQSVLAMLQRTNRDRHLGETLGWTVLWIEPHRTQRDCFSTSASFALQRYLFEAWNKQFSGSTMQPQSCRWGIVQDRGDQNLSNGDPPSHAETFSDVGAAYELDEPEPFHASMLLPAALLGVNVIELLQGASAVSETLRDQASDENMVVQLASIVELLTDDQSTVSQSVKSTSQTLRALPNWLTSFERSLTTAYDLPKTDEPTTPQTAINGAIFVTVEGDRFDSLLIDLENGQLCIQDRGAESQRSWTTERIRRRMIREQRALGAASVLGQIRLPFADELCVGQLMQLLSVAIEMLSLRRIPKAATIEGQRGLDSKA